MATLGNLCMPFYEPGQRVTCHAGAAVTGKRFVIITATRQSGPAVSDATNGGNYVVGPATAGVRAFGVAEHDAALNKKVNVITTGAIVPVTAGGAIAAGAEVEVDAQGRAITLASGKAVGMACTTGVANADVEVKLY